MAYVFFLFSLRLIYPVAPADLSHGIKETIKGKRSDCWGIAATNSTASSLCGPCLCLSYNLALLSAIVYFTKARILEDEPAKNRNRNIATSAAFHVRLKRGDLCQFDMSWCQCKTA